MVKNIVEEVIIPESPKINPNEQLFIYVPLASNDDAGIAKFYSEHFNIVDGEVKLKTSYLDARYAPDMSRTLPVEMEVIPTEFFTLVYYDKSYRKYLVTDMLEPYAMVKRRYDGSISVPILPDKDEDAASKHYVDSNTLDKVTKFPANVHNMPVAYYQFQGNVLPMVISNAGNPTDENTLARRLPRGRLAAADAEEPTDLVNKRYFEANKISKVEFNVKDISSHVYTLELKDSNGGTVASVDVDLPFEAVKIAKIDDKVRDDGTRILIVQFVDGTSLTFELDEIFSGLNELVGDKVDTVTFNEKVTELEKEIDSKSVIKAGGEIVAEFDADTKAPIPTGLNIDNNAGRYKIAVLRGDGQWRYKDVAGDSAAQGQIPVRAEGGALLIGAISKDNHAVDKAYADTKLAKVTDVTQYAQVYIKHADGTQDVVNLGNVGQSAIDRGIPRYSGGGALPVGHPSWGGCAVNLDYMSKYVRDAVAGATLEFTESTRTAYEHAIPEGVASNAILNSVEGANERDENNNILKVGALETVDSLDTNGANFSTFEIPSALRNACGESYGMQWTKLDFDKKRFEDRGVTLVLDGNTRKASYTSSIYGNVYFSINLPQDKYAKKGNANAFTFVSSHFVPTGKLLVNGDVITQPAGYLYYSSTDWEAAETNNRDRLILFSGNLGLNTLDEFNAWLRTQYDNGTPVTFRYQSDTEPVVVDLSSHLTDYKRFKTIPIVEKCGVQFNCSDFVPVTSTITYLRRKS